MEELVVKDSVGEELVGKESVLGDSTVAVGGSILERSVLEDPAVAIEDSFLERSVAGSETGGTARTAVIWLFLKLTRRPYLVSRWSSLERETWCAGNEGAKNFRNDRNSGTYEKMDKFRSHRS